MGPSAGGHWEWQGAPIPGSTQTAMTPANAPIPVSSTLPMSAAPAQGMTLQAPRGHWQWEPMGQGWSATPPRMASPQMQPAAGATPPGSVAVRSATPPMELRSPRGHWEWCAEMPVATPNVQVVEKIVYVDRPFEKIVERIVEKPVYIDRPVPMNVPVPQMPMTMNVEHRDGICESSRACGASRSCL